MRVLICDDDRDSLIRLHNIVDEYLTEKQADYEIASYTSATNSAILSAPFDIAFIDICMPEINGLELSEMLKKKNRNIMIFIVTAFNSYLDDAMEINVYRYITKPFEEERIKKNLGMAYSHFENLKRTIVLTKNKEVYTISIDDILFVTVSGRGTLVQTKSASFTSKQNINYWVTVLDYQEFTLSQSRSLVNLKNVVNFDKTQVFFRKENDEIVSVPMTQRRFFAVKKKFYEVIEKNI